MFGIHTENRFESIKRIHSRSEITFTFTDGEDTNIKYFSEDISSNPVAYVKAMTKYMLLGRIQGIKTPEPIPPIFKCSQEILSDSNNTERKVNLTNEQREKINELLRIYKSNLKSHVQKKAIPFEYGIDLMDEFACESSTTPSMAYCRYGRVCRLVKLRISMIRTFSFGNISHITLYAQLEIV